MKTQRGIAQGWLIGILVFVGAVGLAYFAGRHDGAKLERSEWTTREAAINADAAKLIDAAGTRVRNAERALSTNLAAVDAYYQLQLKGKDDALTIARRNARTNGLWVNAACPAPSGNAASAAPAGPGVGDGTARVRLSNEDADFLITEAVRADKIVDQLTACQAVVLTDRKP